jgi:hypothetical protein
MLKAHDMVTKIGFGDDDEVVGQQLSAIDAKKRVI